MNRSTPGRPPIETDQPQLLSTILDIVEASSSTDERRRSGMIRSVRTLDDLQSELQNLGFNLPTIKCIIALQCCVILSCILNRIKKLAWAK